MTKKYSTYIRFGSAIHDELEDWCIANNTTMDYDKGILTCNFPSQDAVSKFSTKFPTFVEI